MKGSQAYKNEDREDKRYKKGYKKNGGGDEEQEPPMRKKKNQKMDLKEVPIKGGFDHMKAGELRSHLTKKKKALLTKSGFPDGGIPRSKAAMCKLCKKLKRKRW